MFRRFLGTAMLTGSFSILWALPLLAQPVEFALLNIKKAQLVFLRNVVLLDISGCFVLGEGSNGIDPTTGEHPALSFSLVAGVQVISKNIQTGSFRALTGDDGVTVVGYTTGPTLGSEGDTQGLVRVRLREVRGAGRSKSPDPCKQVGTFWRFEIHGSVGQASRQFHQTFQLTIGDDTSGAVEVQVDVRGRSLRGASALPAWALPRSGSGEELELYDLQGRLIFQSARASPAELHAVWRSLPNGVYLYVVTVLTEDGRRFRTEVRKLLLQR